METIDRVEEKKRAGGMPKGGRKAHQCHGNWVLHALIQDNGFWVGRARNARTGQIRWHSTRETNRRRANQNVIDWVRGLEAQDQGKTKFGVLFSTAFEEWLSLKDLRPSTAKEYDYAYKGVIKPFFGQQDVSAVHMENVERFLATLKDNRGRKFSLAKGWESQRKLSRSRRQKYLSFLRGFFRWAKRRRYCKEDPTEGIALPRGAKRHGIALTFDEAQRLLAVCGREQIITLSARRNLGGVKGGKVSKEKVEFQRTNKSPDYLYLAVLIAFHTGLRKGNIVGMRWKHVDLGKEKLSFSAEEMKANADLDIPIHPELLEVLQARAKELGELEPQSFVLGEEVKSFKKSFRWALKQAGLPYEGERRVRFHDLRHTLSTWLAVKYPQAIKDAMLGHAPRGVSGLYTHVPFEELKKAIDGMPRLLSSNERVQASGERPAVS